MLKRTLLLALAALTITVAPALADHGHRRGHHRRHWDSRVAVEATDLAVAAHRLRTAVEQNFRPWNRHRYRSAVWAVERFESEARRFRRFVRRERPGPERLARRFERVRQAHAQAMAELRYARVSRWLRYERRQTRQELRDVQVLIDRRLAYRIPRYRPSEQGYRALGEDRGYIEIDTPRFHARASR